MLKFSSRVIIPAPVNPLRTPTFNKFFRLRGLNPRGVLTNSLLIPDKTLVVIPKAAPDPVKRIYVFVVSFIANLFRLLVLSGPTLNIVKTCQECKCRNSRSQSYLECGSKCHWRVPKTTSTNPAANCGKNTSYFLIRHVIHFIYLARSKTGCGDAKRLKTIQFKLRTKFYAFLYNIIFSNRYLFRCFRSWYKFEPRSWFWWVRVLFSKDEIPNTQST